MIRILLVDDHELIVVGLKALFEKHSDLKVIGEASDGETALEKALQLNPDVIVLNLALPKLTGIGATRKIKEQRPGIKIAGLSLHEDPTSVSEFIRAGGSGFVGKRLSTEDIVKAVRIVAAGGMFIEPEILPSATTASTPRKQARNRSQLLSEREALVVRYVARGHTNKEIAAMLGVSIKTIETYKARSMAKLKAKNRSDLVRYALGQGWLSQESTPVEHSESE